MAGFLDIFKALIGPVLGFAGGAMQGDPYQKRDKFTGSVAPQAMLEQLMGNINQVGKGAADQLNAGYQRRPLVSSTPGFKNLDPGAADATKLRTPGPGINVYNSVAGQEQAASDIYDRVARRRRSAEQEMI